MLAIGIPTLNEADNIADLVRAIDLAASKHGIAITIVNSDNGSKDGTSEIFSSTKTSCEKVALVTEQNGKGYNVKNIFEWISKNPTIDACFLIDGDVTSFQSQWLLKYCYAISSGADYIIPRYKRNYQEGNTTNHFVYPLLGARLNRAVPRQPISGDFGLSRKLIDHLVTLNWTESALSYGVDIFMTINAIYGSFFIKEITLGSKVHKPSFSKMIGMFEEVAASYYETVESLSEPSAKSRMEFVKTSEDLMDGQSIPNDLIESRIKTAVEMLKSEAGLMPEFRPPKLDSVDIETWSHVLITHESMIGSTSPTLVARSLLPWYLLRSTSYLRSVKDPESASKELDIQYNKIVEEYRNSVKLTS